MSTWTPELERVNNVYLRHGMIPSWERVWDGGVDVTDADPSTWPELFKRMHGRGWLPIRTLAGERW